MKVFDVKRKKLSGIELGLVNKAAFTPQHVDQGYTENRYEVVVCKRIAICNELINLLFLTLIANN